MKYLIFSFYFLLFQIEMFAQTTNKNKLANKNGIHWISLEEAQEKMKSEPKKVYIDLYTDWCGWCKVMDKKTFSHKQVIDFMNTHFYCVRLHAETKDSILFKSKMYGRMEDGKTNQLAVEWMNYTISYPNSIFFDEHFENRQTIPGYLDIKDMEMISRYIGENKHKSIPFETYKKSFKPSW